MKFIMLFGLFTTLLLSSSCTTMSYRAYVYDDLPDKTIEVRLVEGSPWSYELNNTTDKDLNFSFKKSAFILSGESYRVISGETRMKNMDRDSPDVPVGAKTTKTITLVPPELVSISWDQGFKTTWKRRLREGDKFEFRFVLTDDTGKVMREKVMGSVNKFETSVTSQSKNFCLITGIIYGGYCWLLPTREDFQKGTADGEKKFGEDTILEYRDISF